MRLKSSHHFQPRPNARLDSKRVSRILGSARDFVDLGEKAVGKNESVNSTHRTTHPQGQRFQPREKECKKFTLFALLEAVIWTVCLTLGTSCSPKNRNHDYECTVARPHPYSVLF